MYGTCYVTLVDVSIKVPSRWDKFKQRMPKVLRRLLNPIKYEITYSFKVVPVPMYPVDWDQMVKEQACR